MGKQPLILITHGLHINGLYCKNAQKGFRIAHTVNILQMILIATVGELLNLLRTFHKIRKEIYTMIIFGEEFVFLRIIASKEHLVLLTSVNHGRTPLY